MFVKKHWLLSLFLVALFLSSSINSNSQFIRVGTAPQEDSRSIIFVPVGGNNVIALAGMKRFGVIYSYFNGSSWTEWQKTGLDEFSIFDLATSSPSQINCLSRKNLRVFAGTSSGKIYYSDDYSSNYTTPWNQSSGLLSNPVMEIVVAPNGEILAVVKGAGIYLSSDSGQTFFLLDHGPLNNNFMGIALHPDYSSTSRKFWAITEEGQLLGGGIYFYDGSNWSDLTPGGQYSFSSILISPEPNNPEAIWVGDLKGSGVLQSLDLGVTWTTFSNLCDPVLTLALAPNYSSTNKHIFVGTTVGLYEIISGNSYDLYPKGLGINSIAPDPQLADLLWFSTSSGIRKAIPRQSFPEPVNGNALALFDISFIEYSPSFNSDSTIFALSKRLGLFASRDGGSSFSLYMPPLERSFASNLPFEIAGFGTSPSYSGSNGSCNSEESTVYLATKGKGIFKSPSAGSNWVAINEGLSTTSLISAFSVVPNPYTYPLYASENNVIYRFDPSSSLWIGTTLTSPTPGNITKISFPKNFPSPPIIYAATDVGLFVSNDGGLSFSFDTTLPSAPSGRAEVTDIAFHPVFNGDSQQTVFVARGGSLFKKVLNGTAWEWQLVGASSFPAGQYFVNYIAISPNYQTDSLISVTFNNPTNYSDDGVWLSSDGGSTFTNITQNLPDRYPETLKFIKTQTGLKLFAGLRRDRLWFTAEPLFNNWSQSLGWETSPTCVNATAMSSVPLPTNCTTMSTPSDLFIGTCDGVFWSNDGGETFRPINEGLVSTFPTSGCKPIEVLSLHLENGFAGTDLQPVLIAGTNGFGVWYRTASQVPGISGWDWSNGSWVQATGVPSNAKVYKFSKERGLTNNVVRAATDLGMFASRNGAILPVGANWYSMELNEDVRGVSHGATQQLKSSYPHIPEAPSEGVIWGTTWGTGVKRGTETQNFKSPTPETITWETRNGSGAGTLEEMYNWAIVQLSSDGSVLVGGDNKGIYRSPDEGLTLWYPSNGGVENTSLRVRDFLEIQSNGDVLCAIEGSGTEYNGGIFISADNGYHWACLSAGFNPEEQKLSEIVSSSSNPPVYYAGTYSNGTYAGSVTPQPSPTVTSIDVTSGPSSGGTTVTITGNNFQCSCPQYYDCTHFGISTATASFGGVDATTTSCSSTQLIVTTPAHLSGTVNIQVRNPDTRSTTVSNAYTYTGSSNATLYVSRDASNNIVITTSGSPTPTKVFRGINPQFTGYVKADNLSSGTFTYNDSSGTNSYIYYYKVE